MGNFTTADAEGWISDWPVEYVTKSKADRVFDAFYAVILVGVLPIGSAVVLSKMVLFLLGAVTGSEFS